MNTESEAAKRKKQEQRRKALRRRWWRRRLSILILAVAILCALIACIVALVHHARKQREPAEEPVSVTEEVTEPESAAGEEAGEIEILEDEPDELFTLSQDAVQTPGDLVLVNSSSIWSGSAGTLVSVSDYKSSSYGLRDSETLLDETVLDPLNRMMDDFLEATGNEDIVIAVGYRSVAEQQSRWDSAVEIYGEEDAALYYDLPGTSEHHTGLAFDLSFTSADGQTYTFDGTGDSAWIVEHSWEYGFVQRYPSDKTAVTGNSDELWHFRYVGPVHAALMHENDLCLEEYLDWLQQYTYDARLTAEVGGISYEIWTAAEPIGDEDGTYTVSSDNRGSYIITKECS